MALPDVIYRDREHICAVHYYEDVDVRIATHVMETVAFETSAALNWNTSDAFCLPMKAPC
jgi:hypothetical protein